MKDQTLYDFFKHLDRGFFLDETIRSYAHLDSPLPIGFEQTISQPTLVLEMTELLNLESQHKVLEVGTGSGYQTAFLAEFADMVYTIEIIEPLANQAKERLQALGYTNVITKIGDGSQGWKEHAPFDRIMVTAAATSIPQALVEQLAVNGRMVIPVGDRFEQELFVVSKGSNQQLSIQKKFTVRFVPLQGNY